MGTDGNKICFIICVNDDLFFEEYVKYIHWLEVPEVHELDSGWEEYRYDMEKDRLWEVEGIDGMLMATQYVIPWREDLFDGWDFYDLSQSFEMKRRGRRIVVPVHKQPWCVHDDKPLLSVWNYDKYRRKFIEEYIDTDGGKEEV